MSGTFVMMMAAGATVEQPIDGQTGVWLKSGGVTISSAMKMTGAVVSTGQSQTVYSKGTASASILYTNGRLFVSNGGIARDCVGNGNVAHGLFVIQGGTASGYTLYSGDLSVNGYPEPGTLIDAVAYDGRQFFQNYATVSNYTMSGGSLNAGAGGAAKRTYNLKVFGGNVSIYNNHHVSGAIISGGNVSMWTANARIFDASVFSGATLLVSGGVVSGCSVTGRVSTYTGAYVTGMTVAQEGEVHFVSGGSGSGVLLSATVTRGAKLYVEFADTCAENVTVGFGGYVVARYGGAMVSAVTVSSGGELYPLYSGSALDVTIASGGHARAGIDGGYMSNVTVENGGRLTVSSGGTALAVTSSAGAVVIVAEGGYIEYVTP